MERFESFRTNVSSKYKIWWAILQVFLLSTSRRKIRNAWAYTHFSLLFSYVFFFFNALIFYTCTHDLKWLWSLAHGSRYLVLIISKIHMHFCKIKLKKCKRKKLMTGCLKFRSIFSHPSFQKSPIEYRENNANTSYISLNYFLLKLLLQTLYINYIFVCNFLFY